MSESTFGGGTEVQASTLIIGDTVRNPRKPQMVMIVEEIGNQIYIRGLLAINTKYHMFLHPNQLVIKVTNAE